MPKPKSFEEKLRVALLEELQGKPAAGDPSMESPDGKGVADKKEETVKVNQKIEKTEICLDGKNNDVDKNIPKAPPKDGKPAEGDASMESPDGKGVQNQTVKQVSTGGDGGDKKALDGQDGKGVQDKSVKQDKSIPSGGNHAKMESIVLPHDVVVEQNGKLIRLKAGTRVNLLKEEDESEGEDEGEDEGGEGDDNNKPPFAKKNDEGGGEGGEGGEGDGAPKPPVETPVSSEMDVTPVSAIDQIVVGLEMTAAGFRQFAAEEALEPEHQAEPDTTLEIGGEIDTADLPVGETPV